jgi:hypothetical protein
MRERHHVFAQHALGHGAGENLRGHHDLRVFKTLCHWATVGAGADEQAQALRCRTAAVPVEFEKPWL